MAAKVEQRTYEDAVSWLRDHGFDLIEAPGAQTRVFLKKYNCSAAIQKTDDGGAIFDGSAGVTPFGLAQKSYVGEIDRECVERQQGSVADLSEHSFSSRARRGFCVVRRERWHGAGSCWCHRQ